MALPPAGKFILRKLLINWVGFDKLFNAPANFPTVPIAEPNAPKPCDPCVAAPEEKVLIPAPRLNFAILSSYINYLVDKIKHVVYNFTTRNHI
jgi:hypothetical protein